ACAPRLTALPRSASLDCAGRLLPLCLGWLRIVGRGGRGQRRTSAGFTVGGVVGISTASSAAAVNGFDNRLGETGLQRLPGRVDGPPRLVPAKPSNGCRLDALGAFDLAAYRRHLMSAVCACLLPTSLPSAAACRPAITPPSGRTAGRQRHRRLPSIDSLVAAVASQLVK
uniref:Os08g0551100 protein n=1 Tax=Macrostomum lignano TaxID=282301 RepID=A0A1I8FE15_9PLAT